MFGASTTSTVVFTAAINGRIYGYIGATVPCNCLQLRALLTCCSTVVTRKGTFWGTSAYSLLEAVDRH